MSTYNVVIYLRACASLINLILVQSSKSDFMRMIDVGGIYVYAYTPILNRLLSCLRSLIRIKAVLTTNSTFNYRPFRFVHLHKTYIWHAYNIQCTLVFTNFTIYETVQSVPSEIFSS